MQRQGQARRPSNRTGGAGHRRRDPREVPRARDPRAERVRAAAADVRALPARPADARCSAPATRRPTSSWSSTRRGPSEVEEGVAFYGRTGNALMKSLKRLSIDPLAVYGTLCVKCPVADPGDGRPGLHRPAGRGAGDRLAQDRGRDGRRRARASINDLGAPAGAASSSRASGELQRFTPVDRGAVRAQHRRLARRGAAPSATSGPRSGCSASGGPTCRPTAVDLKSPEGSMQTDD